MTTIFGFPIGIRNNCSKDWLKLKRKRIKNISDSTHKSHIKLNHYSFIKIDWFPTIVVDKLHFSYSSLLVLDFCIADDKSTVVAAEKYCIEDAIEITGTFVLFKKKTIIKFMKNQI